MTLALRSYDRSNDEMRPVSFKRNYLNNAYGSCMVSFGDTIVFCAATIEESVPSWLKGTGKGWVTAEYSMLPSSTSKRTRRETMGPKGRTHEIQRLIGRSLRSAVNMDALGEITVTVDCDVIQADGGTRTASICGGWVALRDALNTWQNAGKLKSSPLIGQVAAVSVGMVDGQVLLDLDYSEDSRAEIDMNIVMNKAGEFIEVQGTGERVGFDRALLDKMLDSAVVGIEEMFMVQNMAMEA